MNQGQEKFFTFILERVQEDKQEEAKALLAESFQKQQDRTFNMDYLNSFIPKMMSILKPECVEEVKAIMEQFASNLKK
ncbi:hypothetical protein [Bacillus massiliigorillae]|uniref:hypothetical protein n=1 Tax=Bacillus massiliigorillae TaxID=1243664 RepID=UPI0003A2EF21|nr:hypothetical protein [Bacillus massiliigorillae]